MNKGPELDTKRLCEVGADVTCMGGAGVMLMSGDVPSGSLCSSNEVSRLIEQLQFDLGEGPCVDAFRQDRPVLEPDLQRPTVARWVAFAGPAVQAGVRAIFGFPLQVGAARARRLNLYRDRSGPLSDDQHAEALVMANVTAQALRCRQTQLPGNWPQPLQRGPIFSSSCTRPLGWWRLSSTPPSVKPSFVCEPSRSATILPLLRSRKTWWHASCISPLAPTAAPPRE